MPTRALPALLAAALLLAGCADRPAATEGPSKPELSPAPASLEGGVAEGNATAAPGVPEPVWVPVAFDGFLGTRPWACVDSCRGPQLTPEDRILPFKGPGAALALDVTLTWTPTGPLTQRLRLGYEVCSNGCAETRRWQGLDGESPLRFQAEGFDLQEGETLRLFVWVPEQVSGTVNAYLSADQPFRIEGAILAQGGNATPSGTSRTSTSRRTRPCHPRRAAAPPT